MKPADRCSGACIWFFQQARRSIREARRGCASTRRDRTRSAIGTANVHASAAFGARSEHRPS
jgi:hypothetical protein